LPCVETPTKANELGSPQFRLKHDLFPGQTDAHSSLAREPGGKTRVDGRCSELGPGMKDLPRRDRPRLSLDLSREPWEFWMASILSVAYTFWEDPMSDTKQFEDISQEFAADLASLRKDISKLTDSVSELMRARASSATASVLGVVDDVRRKITDTAADTQNRVGAVSADLESVIERNPITAVIVAGLAGLLIGMWSRPRR
jgi:ElaB/YqjD/DUF883 family membrane-anchored ribosome-binding protein